MAKSKFTYSSAAAGYQKLWETISIKTGADAAGATRFAKKIIDGEEQYRTAGDKLGVPWYFIGALHMRESSCNFGGVLHNGEHIIGTGRKTRLVPAGRGPFATWPEAADDAMRLKNFGQYKGQWCPALMGFVTELFNGLGYFYKGIRSPYVWAGSNHEQTGKYVRDHVWDGSFDDTQIGVMTVLKRLCELRPDIAKDMKAKPIVSKKVKAVALVAAGTAAGTGGIAVATDPTAVGTDVAASSVDTLNQIGPLVQFIQVFGTWAVLILTAAVIGGVVWYQFYKRRLD